MKLRDHYARRGRHKGRPSEHEMRDFMSLPPGPEGLSFSLYQSTSVALQPGHRLQVIKNGGIFDELEQAIRSAQRSVHILVFIWRPCEVSDRLVAALLDRRRAGVACRVVVDPVGSESITTDQDFDMSTEQRLREAGVEVHYYRPLRGKLLGRLMGRTHQKIIVVDGHLGFTGGFGIWESWEGDGLSKDCWRDTHVRVEGPAVRDMQVAFARTWVEAGGDLLPRDAFPTLPEDGPARCGFIASTGRLGITDAERMTRLLIAAARERLWISNAYFSAPSAILHLLEEKVRRGVDVRVLAPGPVHDVKVVRASQRSTYRRLLRRGVRIWEYQPSMMHAKTLIADDWLAVIGSTNLDALSLNKLGEGSLVIACRDTVRTLEQDFLFDLQHAEEIKLGTRHAFAGPWKRLARRLTVWAGQDR